MLTQISLFSFPKSFPKSSSNGAPRRARSRESKAASTLHAPMRPPTQPPRAQYHSHPKTTVQGTRHLNLTGSLAQRRETLPSVFCPALAPLGPRENFHQSSSHLRCCGWLPHSLRDAPGPIDYRPRVCGLLHSPLLPLRGHPLPRLVARLKRCINWIFLKIKKSISVSSC